jgi:hypothetical protein
METSPVRTRDALHDMALAFVTASVASKEERRGVPSFETFGFSWNAVDASSVFRR